MKIAIVVLSCFDNSVYEKLYEVQNETWNSIDVENVDTFFLVGNFEENKIEGNLIKTTFRESSWVGTKVVQGLKLMENFDYDYIFRTNSSSYVDKVKLKEYIEKNCDENSYTGIIGNVDGQTYASGCGYILSRKNLNLLIQNLDDWDYNPDIEDLSTGKLLAKMQVNAKPGKRQDIVHGNEELDMEQYHYRLRCDFDRINLEIPRFRRVFTEKSAYYSSM